MNNTFLILTIVLIIVSTAMILIILVQRPQGGGLASAFGGAGGGGTDTVFGGRVGDALTIMTVVTFVLFLGLAVALSLVESKSESIDTTQAQPGIVSSDTTPNNTGITPTPDHPTEEPDSEPDHPTGDK
jgi:preprotein translocase subunit SecG